MKNIFYILITVIFLCSCGPHRMRCGARGICKSPEKQTLEKPKKVSIIKA
ncbi:hypothetical protein ACM55M_08520 [Flavobacterium sp. ZT3R25]